MSDRGVMADIGARLEKCHSAAVFDALRDRGLSNTVLPRDIRPLDPGRVVAGPVFTISGSPKDGLDGDATLRAWTELLARAPAGHVVVCAGNDDTRALMGELSAETLQHRGVRGYITDGGCRDCASILKLGFPVFSRFFTPRDIVGAWTADVYEQALVIGGVTVAPGDFVVADIDGAVVVPGAIAAEVVAEVERVVATENKVRAAILDGVDPREAYLRYGKF